MSQIKSEKPSKLPIVTLLASLLVIVGVVVIWNLIQQKEKLDPVETINYAPATAEEKQASEDHKKDLSEDNESKPEQTNTGTTSNKKSVIPIISAWGQESAGGVFRINGYVPNVIETDGICTITMTKESKKVTETRVALADAKSTTCGQTIIPYSKLSPGEWKAVLSYNSPRSSGSSEETMVEVK